MTETPEQIEQSELADWTDQDLLTRDGATDLLDDEIAADHRRLAELRSSGAEPARIAAAEHRLARMGEIKESLAARSAVRTQGRR